ncbi:MAG: cytochrome c oxidase subunit 3 family protein [Acidobacteriota bacterium]|nr:cytochrome c oxidase subunit 3 family protein [Acidobacteriota bacterium]MDP3717642.1 cytochrome c oxidase subunit 3 family protein [Acidobacteriota bacterium]
MSNPVVHADGHGQAHAAHHPALQHHFETMGQQKEAAVVGMWVFLLTEILFFGGLFAAYMVYRIWYFDAFAEASRSLSLFWGGLNTAVLIGSSLTMAMAVRGAQTNKRTATVNWLILTMILGGVFLGVKVIEYADKFEHHHVPGYNFQWAAAHEAPAAGAAAAPAAAAAAEPHRELTLSPEQLQLTTQIYFSLYFTMTGLHALHMIIGIGIMLVITWMAYHGRFDEHYYTPVEMAGLYWHFVDIVWIFLFPLLYLVERHT